MYICIEINKIYIIDMFEVKMILYIEGILDW